MFIGELNDIIRESLYTCTVDRIVYDVIRENPKKEIDIDSQTNEQSNELQVFKIQTLSDFE